MSNALLSLPQELLLTICSKLELKYLKELRLSCKVLAERLSFLVFSRIGIRANSIEDIASALPFLTNPPSVVLNYTTEITINAREFVWPLPVDMDVQKIGRDFSNALTSLKAVKTLSWHTHHKDCSFSQKFIWGAIRCLPALRTLHINAFFLKVNLENLDTLITLESISIRCCELEVALSQSISDLYASSDNLISMELDVRHAECNLHQLLTCKPKADTTRRLRRLALRNVPIRICKDTLSHLKNLTSLKLSFPLYSTSNDCPDELWNALRLSRTYLEELEIENFAMGHALNDYLSSFSGLKRLKLCVDEEMLADEFWTNSLPNHVDTLQDLSLRNTCLFNNRRWCFGDHNRSVIEKCTKLKLFTINVFSDDFARLEQGSIPEIISTLIETVLTHIPDIERLTVNITCDRCYHFCDHCSQRQLTNRLSKYQPPAHLRDRFANVGIHYSHRCAQRQM